jgi:hypothetical protein
MLCLGGSRILADLFDDLLLKDSRVAAAVVSEIVRNATLVLPSVGPHPKRYLHQSAKIARGRYKELLGTAESTPAPPPELLAQLKSELTRRSSAKLASGQNLHPSANDGEAESVYWAVTESAEVLTNDGDAHEVAASRRVPTSTFVEVARHFVTHQKVVGRRAIFTELMTLSSRNIYPGEHITSELDLT